MEYNEYKYCLKTDTINAVEKELREGPWYWGKNSTTNADGHWSRRFGTEHKDGDMWKGIEDSLEEPIAEVWNQLKKKFDEDDVLTRCYANGSTYGIDNKLHTDSTNKGSKTFILFLNRNWNVDFGGETILFNDKENSVIFSKVPRFNDGLLFDGNIWHRATSITKYARDIRITLMFKTEKPEFII
jgi:hypothetical protein